MAVEFKRILLTENPSLGFQENDLNPFKDATFQPTLEAAMVLNTAAYWKLILKNFMEITPKNWQAYMSEGIKNWKNGTKNN